MGHTCSILSFSADKTKEEITAACHEWGSYNCDIQECGYDAGLPCDIRFTFKVFDNYDEAYDYLNGTFGDYKQTAVRYKKYPEIKSTKQITELERRLSEYKNRIRDIEDTAHYGNVTSKFIKCKSCGSSLSTAFCGSDKGICGLGKSKGFKNCCPVCGKDLRPQSVLNKLASYRNTVSELTAKLKEEQKKAESKCADRAVLCWMVACEVHS